MTDPLVGEAEDAVSAEVGRSGAKWYVSLRVAERVLALLRTVVVARLIGAEELGRFGIAVLTLSILETFTSTGLEDAVVQRTAPTVAELRASWTIMIGRGVLISLAIWAAASPIAEFFGDDSVAGLIRLAAVGVLARSVRSISLPLLRRRLAFKPEFVVRMAGACSYLVIGVGLTARWHSADGLVVGFVASEIAITVGSYLVTASALRPGLGLRAAVPLIKFGRWMLALNVVTFALTEGDDVLVGRLLGTEALGVYQLAYLVGASSGTEVVRLGDVYLFSLYSRLSRAGRAWGTMFLRGLEVMAAPVCVVAGLVLGLAPWFVPVVFGDGFDGAVVPMQILAVWGIVRALGATTSPALKAIGRPDVIVKFQVLMAIAALASLPWLASRHGLTGAALAVCVPNVVLHPFRYPWIARALQLSASDIVRALVLPLVLLGAALAGSSAPNLLSGSSDATRLAVGVVLGLAAAGAAMVAVERSRGWYLWRFARTTVLGRGTRPAREPAAKPEPDPATR